MPLRLYNTLTRQVEDFVSLHPGRVSMYTCGPTVYNYAHIGNFRTFLFEDLLRRWLEASGFEVFHIMNLTDVDDKTIKGALAAGRQLNAHTEQFTQAFFEDCRWLRVRPAHEYPRATRFIAPMVTLIQSLLDKGVAYRGEDGSVYFSIAKFPAYGRLSQLDKRELKTGASGRVTADEYDKENAQDFVLWKAAREEDEKVGAAWDAPFGRGRPGWHIECSAMALDLIAKRYGTQVLDIHCGGVDLIFPHHEDEIAQSCAHTGLELFARVWMHGEFLNIRGAKMSKRYGNVTTPRDLREDGADPGAIRLAMFQVHYRQKLNLTDDAFAKAREASQRLGDFDARLKKADRRTGGPSPGWEGWASQLEKAFTEALNDDLNAPEAVAALFLAVREGNRMLDEGGQPPESVRAVWSRIVGVLDVLPDAGAQGAVTVDGPMTSAEGKSLNPEPPADPALAQQWAVAWAQQRKAAKAARDYKEADRIRDLLKSAGWEVRDNKDGSIEVRRA
ncbi:MAG TPA: cysteine--tRNA ligase [Gemmatimonadales bacterium]|nr:cysteine--tRNA ligase [Gemmatimonadales bacterium]